MAVIHQLHCVKPDINDQATSDRVIRAADSKPIMLGNLANHAMHVVHKSRRLAHWGRLPHTVLAMPPDLAIAGETAASKTQRTHSHQPRSFP